MEASKEVGSAIRAARKRHRLTQPQLAELAGISERTVRDIEKGSASVSFAAVIAVAAVLGLRVEAR